ncbi:cupin domain-containing protein [Pseudonocardia xinjiangensis]|uniref:AraC family transcriptional regulator n=1 Tax=Pseudonocardia xinjiangensis TaxID=75289 RepID=UPI003D8CA0A2
MDPLEHVLSLLRVDGTVFAPLYAGGRWAVSHRGRLDVRCEAVVDGECWLAVEGVDEPLHLGRGDTYLVVGRRPYRMGSDLDAECVPGTVIYRNADGSLRSRARAGTGHDTTLVGVGFTFDPVTAPLLLDVLPPVVLFPGGSEQAAVMRAAIDLFGHDVRGDGLGRTAVLDRLAQVVLIHGLRAYAETGSAGGWLRAALDPQLGPVLRAMHAGMAHRWSLPELAALARMSRSTFALRFKEAVGVAPLVHLLRLRMHSAARALNETDRTIAAIAAEVGYGTESTFSVAYKRVMGVSPGEHRIRLAGRVVGDHLAVAGNGPHPAAAVSC